MTTTREDLEKAYRYGIMAECARKAGNAEIEHDFFRKFEELRDSVLAAEREPSLVAGSSADPVACSCGNDAFRLYRSDGVSWLCCKGCGNAYIQSGTQSALIWMSPDASPDDESADYLIETSENVVYSSEPGSECVAQGPFVASYTGHKIEGNPLFMLRHFYEIMVFAKRWAKIIPPGV